MTVALMWEARAAEGRGEELLAWARGQVLAAEPLRREFFRAPQDRSSSSPGGTRRTTPSCPNCPNRRASW